jgi:hypothetical protein
VNFPCTTAAFTLPHEPTGFVVLCQLAQGLSLVCPAHWRDSSARTYALRLLPKGRSPSRPCLRLVLLVVFISMNTISSRTGDFLPRRSLWRRQVTPSVHAHAGRTPGNPADSFHSRLILFVEPVEKVPKQIFGRDAEKK